MGVGEVGFTIEFGRPGVGVRFFEIQEMTRALAEGASHFEKKNPVTSLMSDVASGDIREDILDEKIMSAMSRSRCRWTVQRKSSGWCGTWRRGSTPWSRWVSAPVATKNG